MVMGQAWNAYRKSEADTKIHPVKLINMLYERVITHVELAEAAVLAGDSKARGENLSKAIAIVAELNSSIKEKDESEAAQFLRGIYSAIMVELPKISISNDVEPLQLVKRYLVKLNETWKETAMKEAGLNGAEETPEKLAQQEPPVAEESDVPQDNRVAAGGATGYGSAKPAAGGRSGLSFAI